MIKMFYAVFTAALTLLLVSCGGRANGEKETGEGMEYAKYLSISEENGYKVVEISDPWNSGRILHRYVLVQDAAASAPEGELPEGTIVKVPIDNIIVYSSVHASILETLGAADRITGVCEPEYMTCKSVKDGIASGRITDCGNSVSPNLERIADARGKVIIASPFENSNYGAAEKLDIPIIEAVDYMENNPLSRSEWVKLFGALLCMEERADSLFGATCDAYMEVADRVAKGIQDRGLERPTLIVERRYGAAWGMPGGQSYVAHLYRDAGADYIFADLDSESSVNMSFETVLTKGSEAEYWIFKYWSPAPMTYADLEAEYPLYSKFRAFKEKRVFGCNTYESSYYDDIVLRPQDILLDLTAIFHPELTQGHTPKYFLPLQ